jgi:hypothetical protein
VEPLLDHGISGAKGQGKLSSDKLDLIEDPETGLALLSKLPSNQTPEQALNRLFWQIQFTEWQNWLAGDTMAVWRALSACALGRRHPPTWLCRAVHILCMPDTDKRACGDLAKHVRRSEAVELVRRQGKAQGDAVWEEAAKLVAGTDAEGGAEAVRKSHQLIRRAGDGIAVTLANYRREVERHTRQRKK